MERELCRDAVERSRDAVERMQQGSRDTARKYAAPAVVNAHPVAPLVTQPYPRSPRAMEHGVVLAAAVYKPGMTPESTS